MSDVERAVVIDPAVTRASELNFDDGDRIGLTITRDDEQTPCTANAELTYGGSLFTGIGVTWYADRTRQSTLRAYYPYQAAGEPSEFTVMTDQRGDGYTQSDFMTAVRSGVTPSSGAVQMLFRHRMVKINIAVTNLSSAGISETGIVSCAVTADVDVAGESVQVSGSSAEADIIAHEDTPQSAYSAIVVPQSAALTFYVRLDDGSERQCTAMSAAELKSGSQYTARLTVSDQTVDVSLNGMIEGWDDDGELTAETAESSEHIAVGTVNWGGVEYPTAVLADGRCWMAANLHYVPSGRSVSATPSDDAGVWYPCDAGKTAVTRDDFITEHGYLYSAEAAHGGQTAEGDTAVQGICPDGWHLPLQSEFEALAAAYPTVGELQASGFGFATGGCVNATGSYVISGDGEMYLWSSTVTTAGVYCFKALRQSGGFIYSSGVQKGKYGASVRCIKDE